MPGRVYLCCIILNWNLRGQCYTVFSIIQSGESLMLVLLCLHLVESKRRIRQALCDVPLFWCGRFLHLLWSGEKCLYKGQNDGFRAFFFKKKRLGVCWFITRQAEADNMKGPILPAGTDQPKWKSMCLWGWKWCIFPSGKQSASN